MQTDSEKWSYRELKNGDKYTPYFPAANGNSTTRIRNAITDETVELMIRLVKETRNQTAKIAKHPDLIGRNLDETLEKVWNFAYGHIQYRLDKEGVEELRTPARAWKDRKSGIDCDCFSIFISSILFNMGIPHAFRIAKYGGKHWQHVYVIVPTNGGYYTLDAVLHNFNQEKTPTQKKDFHVMNVNVLSGVGDFSGYRDEFDDDLGKTKTPNKLVQKAKGLITKGLIKAPKRRASSAPKKTLIKLTPKQQTTVVKIKNTINKVRKKAKEIVKHPGKAVVKYFPIMVLSRNGFYLFLKVFHKKIASKLVPAVAYNSAAEAQKAGISATDYQKAVEAYAKIKKLVIDKLQGEESVLKKAILGKEKTAVSGFGEIDSSLFDDWEYVDMTQLNDSLDGLGDLGVIGVDDAAIGTAIAAAVPLITELLNIMKQSGLIGKDVSVNEMMQTMTDNPEVQTALTAEQDAVLRDDDGDGVPDVPALKTGGGYMDTALDFAKANPLPTALIVGGAAYLIYDMFFAPKQAKGGNSDTKALSGTGSRKRKKAPTKTKLKKIPLI